MTILCKLSDIPEGGSKGFELESVEGTTEYFVVRKGSKVYAYENSCPHTSAPLDWIKDRFIDKDSGHILCATHGALFNIETGLCMVGPCVGDSLIPIDVKVEGINIVIERLSKL